MRLLKQSLFSIVCLVLVAAIAIPDAVAASADKIEKNASVGQRPVDERPTPFEVLIDKSAPVAFDAPAATVFIANPDIADVQVISPLSVMVFGKKEGQTTLKITDRNGRTLAYRTVMVRQNLAALRDALRAVLPNESIRVESVPNGIVLTGEASDPSAVEDARRLAVRYVPKENGDVINRVKVQANNQIQIRVRFAEVSRDVDKRFGIDWEAVGTVGSFAFGLGTGADFVTAGATAITRTALDGETNDSFSTLFNNNHFSVNNMVDALAKNGLVTILAEPSLTAMSGQTASFLAGGEFPVPVPQSADTITIEWKQYGISLAFTPTIVGDHRINLHVRPEVSQLTDTGSITIGEVQVPALTTRRAETTIELNSGQSFAIAGLLNSQQTQSVKKFPFLGDLPVLGPLFHSTRFQNDESELVIIITPYIVKPTRQENLALPTDGFKPPSDGDLFFRSRETNSDAAARSLSGAPRAVRAQDPLAQESAPLPVSAPRSPVTSADAPPSSRSSTPSYTPMPKAPAPAGPGGFIVE